MIAASTTLTRFNTACVELHEEQDGKCDAVLILKAYASLDGAKLRIVLPELISFKQSRIDLESHYIEFERKI